VERMIRIIEDLESITRLEAGELQLEIERFDLSALAKDVIDSLEMNAREKNIKLILGKYNDQPVWVTGDKFRLRQVFLNLLTNSIKYGKINGETRINFRDAGEKIMTEVADNGIGIEKKHLARIFERFYRIDKSRSREAGGTGLGLSIVEHILEAHGQTISVLSTPDVGTVFTFSLKKG
jgi:two-component system, OmpR family, phosphate regulon sensor histidine kinase PhoR